MRALVSRLAPLVIAVAVVALLGALGVAQTASASECPNEEVRQESNVDPTTGHPFDMSLPECRAYEMVSPLNKAGDEVQASVNYVSPSPNGEAISFVSFVGVFAEPEGFEIAASYIAQRTATGWQTHSAAPSAGLLPIVANVSAMLYTSNLASQAVCGNPAGSINMENADPNWQCAKRVVGEPWSLASPMYPQIGSEVKKFTSGIVGASSDLSHIVFNLEGAHLLPEDTSISTHEGEKVSGLYEISRAGTDSPVLRLVSVNNNGEEIGTTPPRLGNSQLEKGNSPGRSLHAVSENGSTVYFEATPTGGAQAVYARVDGTYTVNVSKPSLADCAECKTGFATQLPAEFQGASADGSIVFFTTEQELLAGEVGKQLYEYDFDAPAGQRITLVSRGAANAGVQGVLTSSDDGSHIYFVAQGALTSEANALGERAASGADNLYVFQSNEAHPDGQVSFVAELCSGHQLSGAAVDARCPTSSSDALLWKVEKESQESGRDGTTLDGRYLVLDTYAHLVSEDTNEGQAVYRYDSQTGDLVWASHGVAGFGALDEGKPSLISPTTTASDVRGSHPDIDNRGRAISENGSDIVFTTKEALSPADVNSVFDTYLWHEGEVSLISDGLGHAPDEAYKPENSAVMSANGSNIFFLTTEKLVGQDTDGLVDLYDARIDGGFPAPAKPYECASVEVQGERGEACQGGKVSVGAFGAPASAMFTGGVNFSETPAKPAAPNLSTPKKKTLTRAQKLKLALKQCSHRARKRRAACERSARKRYGDRGRKSSSKAKQDMSTSVGGVK